MSKQIWVAAANKLRAHIVHVWLLAFCACTLLVPPEFCERPKRGKVARGFAFGIRRTCCVCAAAAVVATPDAEAPTCQQNCLVSKCGAIGSSSHSSHAHTQYTHSSLSAPHTSQPMMIIIIMPNVTGVLIAAGPAGLTHVDLIYHRWRRRHIHGLRCTLWYRRPTLANYRRRTLRKRWGRIWALDAGRAPETFNGEKSLLELDRVIFLFCTSTAFI